MNITELQQLENRPSEIYDRLVNETENSGTIFNGRKNRALQILLDTCEYLLGTTDDNPVSEFFD
jgi:hypothetical protein